MGTLDILLLLCFIPALVRGIQKGFVEQVVSIVSIFVGAWLAYRFAGPLGASLKEFLSVDQKVISVISFALIVILSVFLLHLLGQLLSKTLSLASLGLLNRLLGIVFALLKAALVIGLIIFVFDTLNAKWGLVNSEILQNSVVYTALRDASLKVFPYLKNLLNL